MKKEFKEDLNATAYLMIMYIFILFAFLFSVVFIFVQFIFEFIKSRKITSWLQEKCCSLDNYFWDTKEKLNDKLPNHLKI